MKGRRVPISNATQSSAATSRQRDDGVIGRELAAVNARRRFWLDAIGIRQRRPHKSFQRIAIERGERTGVAIAEHIEAEQICRSRTEASQMNLVNKVQPVVD